MYSARDIRNLKSQFKKKALGGYDVADVDQHITGVANQWEQMEEARRTAEDKVHELEDKLRHYEKVELALQEALETARDTARRTEESADRKARLIVEEAELRAQRIIQEAEQERYGLRQDLSHLTNKQNEVAARLRSFLMSELEMLAQFQGEDPVGFIKLIAPERTAEARTLPGPAPALEPALEMEEGESVDAEPDGPAHASVEIETLAHNMEAVHAESPDLEAEAEEVAQEEPVESVAALEPDPLEEEDPGDDVAPDPVHLEELSVADVSDEERAAFDGDEAPAEEAALMDNEEEQPEAEKPRPSMPRSPWPDVADARPRQTIWPPVPRTPDEVESAGLGTDDAEEEISDSTPTATQPAPTWSSPSGFSVPPEAEPPPAPESPGGWSLRSLVTGDDASEAAKDQHREAVRRIMEDMD